MKLEQENKKNPKIFQIFVLLIVFFLFILCGCSEDESQPETVYTRSQLLGFKITGLENAISLKKTSIANKKEEEWKLARNKHETILPNGEKGEIGIIKGKDIDRYNKLEGEIRALENEIRRLENSLKYFRDMCSKNCSECHKDTG